jgi:hypothetical protein
MPKPGIGDAKQQITRESMTFNRGGIEYEQSI